MLRGSQGFTSAGRFGGPVVALLAALTGSPARSADDTPEQSSPTKRVQYDPAVFTPDPYYPKTFDPKQQILIYGGKTKINEPRPLLEFGQKQYIEGPLQPVEDLIGKKNLFQWAFSLFGDWRTAVAFNDNGPGKKFGEVATRLNLEADLSFTATERIHALFRPIDHNGQFSQIDFGPDVTGFHPQFDLTPRTLFFEGDVGNIIAGFSDRYQSFDLPFSAGLVPMLFQNGIWVNDAIGGAAVTIPSRNSAALGISNMDVTFFAAGDEVSTPAIKDALGNLVQHGLAVYAAAAFIEANEGFWEAGLGWLQDYRGLPFDASYGSATVAFTRRYGGWLSNSIRGIYTFGQEAQNNLGQRTADGFILLVENSLISSHELVLVPYLNMWVGVGHPQSLARNADAGGILFNTGILFETDGLTGFPKLDDTAQNTFGAALGVNYLFNLDQQIVLEAATVQADNEKFDPTRPAKADQYGFGARYQKDLTKFLIFRADVMYAIREHDHNISGVRTEIRWKF